MCLFQIFAPHHKKTSLLAARRFLMEEFVEPQPAGSCTGRSLA